MSKRKSKSNSGSSPSKRRKSSAGRKSRVMKTAAASVRKGVGKSKALKDAWAKTK